MTSFATRTLFVALAALSASTLTVSADVVDRRQGYQERRIQQGLRSGELTRREAAALEAEQARIRELERRAEADGRVDPYERARLRQAQNEASRHIAQESHDAERRGSGFWRRFWWR